MSWTFKGKYSLLTADTSGTTCVVADGTKFKKGWAVTIKDDNNSETNVIVSISGNTLTMENTLATTYYVAANGEVIVGGVVTLPHDPKDIKVKPAADIKSTTYPKQLPLLLSFGNKAKVLTLEGWIVEDGKTKEQLFTDYISVLESLLHHVVTINGPGVRHDGDWLLNSFPWQEPKGYATAFPYKLEFWKGYKYVVL